VEVLVLLGTFFALVAFSIPVAYSMGLAALIAASYVDIPWQAAMIKMADGVNKFSLLAIPFFVLAGAIMAEGGMARRLVAMANVMVGFIRGGLALVNILASTMFGCISGSAVADTSSIGSVMIPQMVKNGYPRVFATNVTIAGSVQAILIPPSHNAVLYSLAAGGTISVAHLFAAGFFPGLLLGGSLIGLVLIYSHIYKFPKGEAIPLRQAVKIMIEGLWGLGTMIIILGGILGGIFTATESAAVAVVYAFCVTMFVYRDYRWRDLHHLVHRTVKTVSMVMMLIAFASCFGYIMALMQIPAKITEFFLTVTDNKYLLLFMINLMLLVLGAIMDMAPLILICTPILLPVVMKFGVDPIHFGMIMMINLGIGLVTPPVGAVLFVGCAVGKVSIEHATRHLLPFLAAMLVALGLVTYVPWFSLFLPSLLKL
jgi:tripartite ATP-independent transporter DctM subunit